jgi:hypothetical protein
LGTRTIIGESALDSHIAVDQYPFHKVCKHRVSPNSTDYGMFERFVQQG